MAAKRRSPDLLVALVRIPALINSDDAVVLTDGRNRNVKIDLVFKRQALTVVVKAFSKPSLLKNALDRRHRGSKARRTWLAAVHLDEKRVGTPEPVAFLERWVEDRLVESYYVAVYQEGVSSFGTELKDLFRQEPECAKFMGLMQAAADGVRAMHDAGFQHNDLGNQNILLRRSGEMEWSGVQFLDLNRGRIRESLTPQQRARDVSRIYLPSDLLRVFKEMYWGRVPPEEFQEWEQRYRQRYAWHANTRCIRHPLREYRIRKHDQGADGYPAERDMWIWDERSGQAQTTLLSKDRSRLYPFRRHLKTVTASLRSLVSVWGEYRLLCDEAYCGWIPMRDRVGMAVEIRGEHNEAQFELLAELGPIPVMVRFYHHKSIEERGIVAAAVRRLREAGHSVSIALVQDRAAVTHPESWAGFVEDVLQRIGDVVEMVEVGHAINRVKWGIWDFDEYRRLIAPVARLAAQYPDVTFSGPAVIDFEYPYVLAALGSLPDGFAFGALSHHLYVDRRGAPENRQGRFSTLEKCALARAIARRHERCGNKLIVSEVNWPILGTGVHSPVGSPYVSPGPRFNDPSVSEDDYADYMIRYLLVSLCSGLADRVYWWRLAAYGYGLIDDSDSHAWRQRPAFVALREFLHRVSDAAFEARAELDGAGAVAFAFRHADGSPFWIAYSTEDSCEVTFPEPVTRGVDICGESIPVEPGGRVVLSGRPVYLA